MIGKAISLIEHERGETAKQLEMIEEAIERIQSLQHKPKRQYRRRNLHWTQRPENRAKVKRWQKKMLAARGF